MLRAVGGEETLGVDISGLGTPELFVLYRSILAELRDRQVIRTENAPAGDYAEYLIATALGGTLAPNSEKSWDVLLPDQRRIQVKARVVSSPPTRSQRQLSPFRSFDFDALIVVLLANSDYSIWRAVEVPAAVVKAHARRSDHVNGSILHATDDILDHELATDLTLRLGGSSPEEGTRG